MSLPSTTASQGAEPARFRPNVRQIRIEPWLPQRVLSCVCRAEETTERARQGSPALPAPNRKLMSLLRSWGTIRGHLFLGQLGSLIELFGRDKDRERGLVRPGSISQE